MDILSLTVGKIFDHGMPDESMSIVLNNGTPMLTFNFSVSENNIDAFQNGLSSFGLFASKDLLFFLFKIEGFLDWSDLAFTIQLAKDETIEDNGGLPSIQSCFGGIQHTHHKSVKDGYSLANFPFGPRQGHGATKQSAVQHHRILQKYSGNL